MNLQSQLHQMKFNLKMQIPKVLKRFHQTRLIQIKMIKIRTVKIRKISKLQLTKH